MDWLAFFKSLAESFFKAFAHAVQEYPLPTTVVFLAGVVFYLERLKSKGKHDPLFALVVFVCAVIASNVLGWLFNGALWILKTLFGWSEVFVGPFARDPVAFLLSFVAASLIGCLYLLYRYNFRLRQIPVLGFASLAMFALFFSYISTNVYVQVARSSEPIAKAAVSKKI